MHAPPLRSTPSASFADCTRNRIRLNVLPELEKAVSSAAEGLYRFSRLAAEDEKYFTDLIKKNALVVEKPYGAEIKLCPQAVVFRRAAAYAVKNICARKDYTSEHMQTLYNLQFAENGKKFVLNIRNVVLRNICVYVKAGTAD